MLGKRKVTTLTRKRAFGAIKEVAKAVLDGEKFISYSELASRLGMPNESGQGLGPILNEAAEMCKEHGLPDISALIVTKESLNSSSPFPSLDSFKNGKWGISGLTVDDFPNEQKRVQEFDWKAVKTLNL